MTENNKRKGQKGGKKMNPDERKLSIDDTEMFCKKYKSCTECPLPSRGVCAYAVAYTGERLYKNEQKE